MLQNKTILITGSSRGIGASVASAVQREGGKVILHGKTESIALINFARKLNSHFITCDVSDKKQVNESIKTLIKNNIVIDGLVNSAGINNYVDFLTSDDDEWIYEYKVNLLGTVHFCQAILPHMKKQKNGSIVNIASFRGHPHMAGTRSVSYSITKAAVISLTSSLAKLYAPNIRINAVSPGFTLTDFSKNWSAHSWEETKQSLLKRAAQPEEIAELIVFLLSQRASYITGQTYLADGGYSISYK